MKNFSLFIAVFAVVSAKAQHFPAATQSADLVIENATIHDGNLRVIENGKIVCSKGKIVFVGKQTEPFSVGANARIIDAADKHVYPGFIIPNATLGLIEIDAVKASVDEAEIGKYNPNVRSIIAYNSESKIIETARTNGVLIAQITPRGGVISGTSSIVQLDSWNWKDAIIDEDDGLHISFPFSYSPDYSAGSARLIANKEYDKQVSELEQYLTEGRNYLAKKNEISNQAYVALKANKDRKKGVFVRAYDIRQIQDAVLLFEKLGFEKIVIVGGTESHKITAFLKQHNVSVMAERVHSLPALNDDPIDMPFRLPGILYKAGITVALENSSEMERMNNRNLPFMAGTAAGYGLNPEEALQLITLNAAKILGISNNYGSLEVGKSATLIVSAGDALDMRTNQIEHAFIDGRALDLSSHQSALYEKYKQKYKQE